MTDEPTLSRARRESAESGDLPPRWLVTTAIGHKTLYDGSPLRYDTGGLVREDTGYAAIVEADTAKEAAQKAIEWLDAEGFDLKCDNCERPHAPFGVDVIRYDDEGVLHLDGEVVWKADDDD